MEKLNNFAILSIDLCQTLDALNHSILLKKLEIYAIRGIALNLINSYLIHRKQYVSIINKISSVNNINCGVPQGSVFSPLLLILNINDLPIF